MYTRKELQEQRAKLSAEELKLLQKRLSGRLGDNRATHSIPRRPDNEFAPLSFLQERLWFLFEWEPDSPSYNEAQIARIEGQLDLKAFEAAYLEIARRHEILRTTYQIVEDRPVQVIAPTVNWSLSLVDLSGLPAEVRGEEMQRLAKEEANRPFDLKQQLSWRVFLVRLVEDEHIVLATQHHISCDGWSIKVRDNEFATLYAAFAANKRVSLPELPIQYADFAHWQRQQLRGEKLAKSLNYWKAQLADLTPLQLPINGPRPKILASKGATLQRTISSTLTKAIDTLSQQEKVTSFVVALTVFKVLLYRYAGQTDIAVGSTMVHRDRPELEGLIGFLVETIILRTDLSGNLTFRDLIHKVHQVTMEAYAHKDVPFTAIATGVQENRDSSRMHLAQVFFEWQDLKSLPSHQLEIPNLKKTENARRMLTDTAKFDLSLFVEKHEEKLVCWWEYNTDLFESHTITRMIGHFETLLTGALTNPDTRLADLPLLTVGEQEQWLAAWNDTGTDFPLGSCFHELFEAQVKRTPDAIAAVCEETQLTYLQLDQLANRLASTLIERNITHNTVALFAERSPEFLISMLGIFKAGGAYLPLDPHYPVQRLRQILTQSQCSVVLSADNLVSLLSEAVADLTAVKQPTILRFSDTQQQTRSTKALPVEATPYHLAYVIYTSGSTGIPKGAMVEQRGMVNHLYAKIRDLQLTAADIVAQTAPQSFDISVWQFLAALLIGGRVQIFRDDIAFDPARLPAEIAYHRVTTWETVPSLLRAMMEEVGQSPSHHSLTALRWLIPTGEALPPDVAYQWLHYFPNIPLINAYGPTECSDDVTHYFLAQPSAADVLRIPIGRPIANMRLYVLDPHLQPVPMGVAGELYVGGVGVGRGYLYDPKRTAETFIPDPFSLEPNARLYKTGDLVCHRPDENLEFLGRIDNQVKVRGHRIELGEIEAVLSQHTAVREAVVVVREDKPGHKQLVVYMVLNPEMLPLSADGLRHFLRGKLPDYMVPTAFVMLDALPLTPNGKVNRKALPTPDEITPSLSVAFVPPREPIEIAIASTWADVLELEQVGIYDNFFELGGHSLLATQVVSRLRHIFQIELPLRQLFAAPTVAELALIITQARRHEQGLQTAPIVPVARDGFLPLSFAQQRLWFLDQLEPNSPLYNMPDAIRMTGSLSVSVFERSLNEIIRRHETLRTSFIMAGEQPVQVILPFAPMMLPVVDLQWLPEAARETEAWHLATAEAQRPFNLEKGPLFRAVWLQLASDDQALLTNTHHIISDGWSTDIFSQELRTLYRAFSSGHPSPLPELPIQYADFACWQQQWLQGDVLEKQMAYWQHQLSDLPLMLLPTDRPRPPVQTSRGDSQLFTLPETIANALKQLSNQEGTTLFMTLLAAFQVLLARYTGQEDVIVGSPIANRNHFETEKLIGFFVNALVLRTDLSGDPTFRELLDRVREVTLDAYDHQDLPFEKLVEELQPERDLSHTPLFQVVFVFEKVLASTGFSADLVLKPMGFERGVTKFDLTLFMIESEQGLSGVLEYNIDLFMPETIAGILAHFQVLLEGIVANPDQRLSDLPLLTKVEKEQLLIEWNETSVAYAEEKHIHKLFELQVERTPDAVAVIMHDSYLTYAELNSRANQLAHYLRLMGVGPEVLVGICIERSINMMIGLLGILKAGGGYVPLDPAYPQERLAFMLADAGATVLLTQQRLLAQLPPYEGQAVCLDTSWQNIAQMDVDNLKGDTAPGNLAYIIYTSGSTGQPKGVAIEHRNAAALLHWATDAFGSEIFAGTLAATSICFDLSVFEMFVPLSCGGTVIMAETALHLADLPAATAVSLVNTVPSAMKELMRLAAIPDSVQVVNLAGELLSTQLVQQIYQQETIQKVFDLYGPSEDTTYSTFALRNGEKPPTVGRPIANTQLYLLDGHLNAVPIGVPGEVYISGAGLARGYLGHPGLTAEKFIPNPYGTTPGDRLYRTGDQARYQFDGNIEFLGRRDYQVKVRGYRIELEEIAAALKHHTAVQDAVVVARDGKQDHKQIIAYVLSDLEQPANDRDLHRFLQEKLPDYMLPAAFVMLESFPLTPNGKVNRRALPAPDESKITFMEDVVLPRTPIEEAIVGAWANVLELEQIGIHDNFFELGGHSLLATQVISRLRNIFQVELPLRQLFAAPTVADLAVFIAEARHTKPNLPVLPILPVPRRGFLPLSFAQQRLWFLDQLEPNNSLYNMPHAVRLTGHLSVSVFAQSLNEIMRRHEVLRTTFAVVDSQPVQVIAPFSAVTLPVVDLQSLPEAAREAEVQRWAAVEARRPFDLMQGPLFRAIWLQLTPNDQLLFTTMHHIISDGWSVGILAQELRVLYQAFSRGASAPLQELPIQYADFALWQQQWLQGDVWEAQMGYWRQQLAGLPSLSLPTDYPRPAVPTYRGESELFVLPETLAKALQQLSNEEGVTLFMFLLAAFQLLLARYTGQEDIAVGSPIANRNHYQTEKLMGLFVNTLVLRTDLSGNPTFRELLARVREVTLSAYDHQELPFEKLVEELRPERVLNRNPLFQVLFIFNKAVAENSSSTIFDARPVKMENGLAEFDLTLSVVDTKDGLIGSLEYTIDLFNAETIERMVGHFQELLASIVAHPDQRLFELNLLPEKERQQLAAWNDTAVAYAQPPQGLHELFAAQVDRTPEATALVYNDTCLTYRALDERANQLAHYLQQQGVGPETLVVVCLERSLELVVALLGILKAGGGYVPLDPAYPAERQGYILEDSGAALLLTSAAVQPRLPATTVTAVCLEEVATAVAGQPARAPSVSVSAANTAYVIYTSGSTGQPKGTIISHAAIGNHLAWMQGTFPLYDTDVVLQKTPISFDVSMCEIFGPLTAGARLVLAQADEHQDSHYLVELINTQQVSLVQLVPSLLQMLLLVPAFGSCRSIKRVYCGGEALPAALIERFYACLSAELYNMYGPTEATIDTTYWACEREWGGTAVPIGRPIANAQTYLLDRHLQPVPVGVPGELYVGGAGLARGYHARPGLTAEKFIPHPFSPVPGARLYKTGDLVRCRADGNLEFLGRKDHQVKVRGYRIELGEIEAVLGGHEAIAETVVQVREDAGAVPQLVAYVVAMAGQAPGSGELRHYLQQRLPEYMVPAHLVMLEALPLTPNGKIDRRALPTPGGTRPELESSYVAPRTLSEEMLTSIWSEILGIERVGIHDNFFELGGHSMLAIRLMAQVQDTFQLELTLRLFFQKPTIAALAMTIDDALLQEIEHLSEEEAVQHLQGDL